MSQSTRRTTCGFYSSRLRVTAWCVRGLAVPVRLQLQLSSQSLEKSCSVWSVRRRQN